MDPNEKVILVTWLIWTVGALKVNYDSMKLHRAYKEEVDPTFPEMTWKTMIGIQHPQSQMEFTKKYWQVFISKPTKSSNVNMQLTKVRFELLLMILCFIILNVIMSNLFPSK